MITFKVKVMGTLVQLCSATERLLSDPEVGFLGMLFPPVFLAYDGSFIRYQTLTPLMVGRESEIAISLTPFNAVCPALQICQLPISRDLVKS